MNNAVFLLKNGEISGNTTTKTETHGGGVRVTSGTFRYITCKFESNAVLASKSRGPDVFINAGVLYATTENGSPRTLAADITTVDGLKNP